MASTELMPVGSIIQQPIREDQVETTEGGASPPEYAEDAAATLVWMNFQRAKQFIENDPSWLLQWQETDALYQSNIRNRSIRVEDGRPARVPRFLVAKFTRTLARAVKRGLFAEQVPFLLRPEGKTTQEQADAWTTLLKLLLKRAKFQYHGGLQIDCQTLQGTGIGKMGWNEKKVTRKTRKRKDPPVKLDMPSGQQQEVPTTESDEFAEHTKTVTESWPFYEYRRLGTTLFDPKWCTPDMPGESAGYCIDVDFVTFEDLQEMRQLSCYQEKKNDKGEILSPGIPSEEALKRYFFTKQVGSAPPGSQVEDRMTSQGGFAAHAEGRNKQTDISPLEQPLMLVEMWTETTVKTILCYDGQKLLIRNEEHDANSMCHTSATWWPIDNSGYGMGIGKVSGPDQRINQGVLNECLKMIAYPLNAPILVRQGENTPTQNVISRMGGVLQVQCAPGEDVRKGMGFMDIPAVPADAWKMIELSQRGGEELTGADAQMQQGVQTGRQGASRSSFGAQRMASMSDQNIADPVDSFANGAIIPFVNFLIHMVKTRMPLPEIREILSVKHAKVIEEAIALDQFLAAEFEVTVLAGQKLLAKQGIQQLIPFLLQILQQPQIMDAYHQIGRTIDLPGMMDVFLQVSELVDQPGIFRKMTEAEKEHYKQANPGFQKVQAETAKQKLQGQREQANIHAKGEVDMANTAAKTAMEHIAGGVPLERAEGLVERGADVAALRGGLPDAEMQ
jgi:hypothetical protein